MSNWKWILTFFRDYKKLIFLSIMSTFVRSFLLLCPPFLTKSIIDNIIPNQNGNLLIIYSIFFISIPVVTGVIIIWDLKITTFILKIGAKHRADLYNSLQYRSLNWFKSTNIGDNISRITEDSKTLINYGYSGASAWLFFLSTIIIGLTMMFFLEWRLTVGIILLLIFQIWIMNKLRKHVKNEASSLAKADSNLLENIRETVSGIALIKNGVQEEKYLRKFERASHFQNSAYKKFIITDAKYDLLYTIFIALITCLLYIGGGYLVNIGNLTIGSLVALIALYSWVQPMIYYFQIQHLSAIRVIPLIERIRELYQPISPIKGEKKPKESLDIRFKKVSLAYDQNQTVVEDLTFDIPEGDSIALIGNSGSGKSSFGNLILNLINPDSGIITIGGIPIQQIDNTWLRKHVLCVTQDVQLRPGTILQNLIFYKPNATDKEIDEAIKIAGLSDWINHLPDGLYTSIGEDALQISGGERQRISIARVVLCRPSILIMDEATSALDNLTESELLTNISKYLKDSTLITITHKKSVLRFSERVIRLDGGKITIEKSFVNNFGLS